MIGPWPMTPFRAVICVIMLLVSGFAGPVAAAEIALGEDGWYRWVVPVGARGMKTCCYEVRAGKVRRVACRLGDGMNEFSPAGDCDVRSDTMQIFVALRNGQVREIRPLSSACPVRSDSEVRTIDQVSTEDSIAWLRDQVNQNPGVADEAIMTLSFHAEDEALDVLVDLLEDTGQRREAREQALFWLVQSDSDEAFAYIDRLLD